MSLIWIDHVKAYAEKNKISYKQALKDASPSYKTRNEKKPEEPKEPKQEEPTKPKRKSNKKVVENITLKF
jgi:hypothetical protein